MREVRAVRRGCLAKFLDHWVCTRDVRSEPLAWLAPAGAAHAWSAA